MNHNSSIYVAGHNGMVGSAIVRELKRQGFTNIITQSSSELDLRKQSDVDSFFESVKPEYVFLAAAKVGGIVANDTYRSEFIYDNIMIEANVIHSAHRHKVKKLLFLGSSCIYPKHCPQPIKEEYLLIGSLESTNEPYAIAKIAGLKMCESYRDQYGCNFISAMPTNLFGTGDNYDIETSHVIPAMIAKMHRAKLNNETVTLFGDGSARREFMFSDDLAKACIFLMLNYNGKEHVNVGTGEDMTIKELAYLVAEIVGYEGSINWDESKPNGTPRKVLDVSKLHGMGFIPHTPFKEALKYTYREWLKSH